MEIRNKQTAYKQAFNEKAYDRLAITIPKGQKATVQAAAEQVSDLGLADVAAQGEEHNRHGEDAESNICRV